MTAVRLNQERRTKHELPVKAHATAIFPLFASKNQVQNWRVLFSLQDKTNHSRTGMYISAGGGYIAESFGRPFVLFCFSFCSRCVFCYRHC